MTSPRSTLRNIRGWIGATLAAVVVVAGAAAGAEASPSGSTPSMPSMPSTPGSTAPAGSSSANDPHEAAAQREVTRMLAAFQPPPGATKAGSRPDPLPSAVAAPPMRSGAQTQVDAAGWYQSSESPDQVLAAVRAHPPIGSSLSAWSGGGSSAPAFVSFAFPGADGSLIVTPVSGADGRTIIRLDADVDWTPSRPAGSALGYGAPSVSVVTITGLNPRFALPPAQTRVATATAPLIVHQVVDLLNALQPPIPGARSCPMDDGTRVRITLPGLATVDAEAGGCGGVTLTPQGGAPQHYAGAGDLITEVYALFGITWSRTGGLPPSIERTEASGTR